jgi:hypothetical protein
MRTFTLTHLLVALALALAIIVAFQAISARADGLPPGPPGPRMQPGIYPVPVAPPPGSPSCMMTALQLGYLTGRREIAYSGTEACMYFTGARGAVLPYGFYGPYVPSGWIPPGWAVPFGGPRW